MVKGGKKGMHVCLRTKLKFWLEILAPVPHTALGILAEHSSS